MSTIKIKTTDGVTIVGDFLDHENGVSNLQNKAVLLLHMMPAVRQSYDALAKKLNAAGFATLAIDLRGHGESTERQIYHQEKPTMLDYKTFTPKEHQASRLDVDASMNFLKSNGYKEENISFVGASIGANLALDALDRYDKSYAAVLLSPGLDYRGLKAESLLKGIRKGQRIFFVAAKGDEYSEDTVIKLLPQVPKDVVVQSKIYNDEEHGTDMFRFEPDLMDDIVTFLS